MNKLVYGLGILFLTLPIMATSPTSLKTQERVPTSELDQETPITLPKGAPKGVLVRVQNGTADVFFSEVESTDPTTVISGTNQTGQATSSFALDTVTAGTGLQESSMNISELDQNDSSSPAWFYVHYRGPRWYHGYYQWVYRGYFFPYRHVWMHRQTCCVYYYYRYMPW